MARRIAIALVELMRSGMVGTADYLILPDFKEGETLGQERGGSHSQRT